MEIRIRIALKTEMWGGMICGSRLKEMGMNQDRMSLPTLGKNNFAPVNEEDCGKQLKRITYLYRLMFLP
jgi:hypothetical protein